MVQLTDSTGKKISKDEEEGLESFNVNDEGVIINGVNLKDMERIPVAKPDLEIMASENDSFYVQQIVNAQGKNKADAIKNSEATTYPLVQVDTMLNLSPYLYVGKNGKWRAQSMKIRFAIPEGKKIRFAENIDLWHAVVKGDNNFDDTYFANTTWTVENGKVKCITGENHFNADEKLNDDEIVIEKKSKKLEEKSDEDDKDKDF